MCQSAYHIGCFRKHERDAYPVLAIKDLDNSFMNDSKMADDDSKQFEVALDEDHMMVPFQ